jgi:hypothetical protein
MGTRADETRTTSDSSTSSLGLAEEDLWVSEVVVLIGRDGSAIGPGRVVGGGALGGSFRRPDWADAPPKSEASKNEANNAHSTNVRRSDFTPIKLQQQSTVFGFAEAKRPNPSTQALPEVHVCPVFYVPVYALVPEAAAAMQT